jgi:hypothetical protein
VTDILPVYHKLQGQVGDPTSYGPHRW